MREGESDVREEREKVLKSEETCPGMEVGSQGTELGLASALRLETPCSWTCCSGLSQGDPCTDLGERSLLHLLSRASLHLPPTHTT